MTVTATMICRGCGARFEAENFTEAGILFDRHNCNDHPYTRHQIDRRFCDEIEKVGDYPDYPTTSHVAPWSVLWTTVGAAILMTLTIATLALLVFYGAAR